MSFPVNPSPTGSVPKVVSLPQMQRIIQDIYDCIQQLKDEFSTTKSPITDDSQVLQRFCAKLEYLLQFDMKERFTLLGKRKDYWDYFCDCLASNKGANDGIKYVKALGEHKSSLGKGRAFMRFSLVHQRLADSLQQCVIHAKTMDWYNPGSVWMRHDLSSSIINTLYDLNSLHFDLSPRGYDLDNAWPSFARNTPGAGNWNVPASRRSSITSMDTLSLASTDPSEISRLQQELASAETARSVLAENVTTLEQERQRAEQSVWMTQGELSAMQEQLKVSGKKCEELQKKYADLEQSHNQLQTEKTEQDREIERRETELSAQQQQLSQDKEQLAEKHSAMTQQLETERSRNTTEIQTLRQSLIEATDSRDKLTSKLSSLEETLEQMRSWDTKKDQQISRLEQQTSSLEQRNKELTDELAKSLSSREQDAASQLDSAQKFHDLLSKMKDVEAKNVELQGSVLDLKHRCEVSDKMVEEERLKFNTAESKLKTETEKYTSMLSDLEKDNADLKNDQATKRDSIEKLEAELTALQTDYDRTRTELHSTTQLLTSSQSRQQHLTQIVSQLMKVALDSSGASVNTLDISSCSEDDVKDFVKACQQSSNERLSSLQSGLDTAEKREATLIAERDIVKQTVSNIVGLLPDKPDSSTQDLSQQIREVETGVQSMGRQLSDVTTDNTFLKQQLHLAQGEHSDKGKQLSHLEGRLLELEKTLKESRAAESSLQSQAASTDTSLKTSQQQNQDLQCQLDTAQADLSSKTQALHDLQSHTVSLETQVKELERQESELKTQASNACEGLEEGRKREEGLRVKVEQLESSLETTRCELEEKQNQLNILQGKVKEGEETVEKFLASMASLETDKASVITEHETLQQQLSDLTTQLHTATTNLQQLETEKESTQQELSQLSQQNQSLKVEVNNKQTEITSLQQESQTNADKHAQETGELKNQVENIHAELSETKQQLLDSNNKLLELTALKESVETERDSNVQKLKQTSTKLQMTEVSFSEQVQSLRAQLETFQTEKEELRKSASSSQEETTKLLTEKQNVVSSLQQEKTDLEKQIKNLTEQNQHLQTKTHQLQTEMEDITSTAKCEKAKLAEDYEQGKLELEKIIDTLKQQNDDLSTELEQIKKDLHSKLSEIENARQEIQTTKSESERLRSDSASEKSELERDLEQLQSRFSELQTAMDALIKEKEDVTASHLASQEEITELKADLASSADGYNFLLQSSQKVQDEKDGEIETLKSQVASLTQTQHELETTSSQKQTLEEKLENLQTNAEAWRTKGEDLDKTLAEKNQELSDLTEQVKTLNVSVAALEEDDRARREEITRLEGELEEKERVYSTQVESLEQELSALQFQMSAEQLQHQESLRCMGDHETSAAEMASRLSDQDVLISDLEKELSSLQMDFATERTNQNQQLDELKSLLKAKENECRLLADQLKKTGEKLEEMAMSSEFFQKENRSLRDTHDRDIDEREAEIRTLRSDNEQLKNRLIKAVRDKAALWEQTDALAYEHKRKSEGKWMDNSTVNKCMGCQADFSLFLRKHHCRLCGRIFCFNCSDNWVDSASSSRKARACGQCYKDQQDLDASVARASLLPNDSDDDASNVGSDSASQYGSQMDSQSQSSLLRATSPDTTGKDNNQASSASSGEDVYGSRTSNSPDLPDVTSTPRTPSTVPSDASVSESASQDGAFQVITQDEVTKSIAAYDDNAAQPQPLIDVPNMSSSMLLSADDLATGEINTHNETWVKPGRSFAVPISIDTPNTVVTWQFTVHPKDIEFSITYHHDSQQPMSQAEILVSPTRCNSVKEPISGELTAKQAGVYTLLFDNSYSRMTSKKISYTLNYAS